MLIEAIAIGGLGFVAALGLGVVARVFYVETDPLVEAIEEVLPGANCGGCGYPGCSGAAEAMAAGNAPANACVGGGPEVQAAVAALLGVEIKETEPRIAQVGCRYPVERSDLKYRYQGLTDCRAAVLMAGGPKECPVGCIGLGSCVKACPFDALSIGPDGLPVVDEYRCTGCGTCVRTCPVGIMQLTSVSDRILGEYTTDQCTAPCQRTCPAGIDVPEQIRQTALGNYDQALLVIKERNPLPLICGRICPHPCELACRRNLADEGVAINPLKRFVSDRERESGQRLTPYCAPKTGRKVAIIGGGAEGLSAGWFLARLGHSPAIFEALPQLGGILRTVIPPSRLPREVLDWEIQGILEIGVQATTGVVLGRDFTLASLFEQGFEAVLLATGGWDSLLLRGQRPEPAPTLPGIYLQLPLSLALAGGEKPELGRAVAIVDGGGGSEQGLALAGRIKKLGVEKVYALFRAAQEDSSLDPALVKKAQGQGVEVVFGAKVLALEGAGDEIQALVYRGQDQEEDQRLEIQSVVAASLRLPEIIFTRRGEAADGEPQPWRTILPYNPPPRQDDGLFQSSEPVGDYAATVEAIGAGRRAAGSIHHFLNGEPIEPPEHMIGPETKVLDVTYLENLMEAPPRQPMPTADPEELVDPLVEVEKGYSEAEAKAEAQRCLNCGLLCYYRSKYN